MDEKFREKTLALRGREAGEQWLNSIPNIIRECEDRWSIKVGQPFELSFNYVAPATRSDGNHAVLKIGFPGDEEFTCEVEALKIFNGDGITKLLEVVPDNSVVLLERLEPGLPVSSLEDDEATLVIASIMKKLWKPVPARHHFPTLNDWSAGFDWFADNYQGKTRILPLDMAKEAQQIFKGLLVNPSEQYLLHGDLHHENVLSARRKPWLAIDPKGVIGEREYEGTAMLRNPYQNLSKMKDKKAVLRRRLDILEEKLGFDRKRMLSWGFSQTVLSVIWSMQNHSGREKYWVDIAKLLYSIS